MARIKQTLLLLVAFCAVTVAIGCSNNRETNSGTVAENLDQRQSTERQQTSKPETSKQPTEPWRTTPPAMPQTPDLVRGFTYGDASGNRVVGGEGRLPNAKPIDVPLTGTPLWVVGTPLEEDTGWTVAYGDGRVDAFRLDGESGRVDDWLTSTAELPPGAPPAVTVDGERLRIPNGGSALTHPLETPSGIISIGSDGAFTARPGEAPGITALPDGRIVENSEGAMAVLTSPSSRYEHGVLGDELEAEGMSVLKRKNGGYILDREITPESGGVFEGIAPFWFDTEEGQALAITESVDGRGSRVSVYAPDGNLISAGPFFDEPQKWRHLIAAGPFGPNGETELVATRTPHLEAITEFYRLNGETGDIELVATGDGYPTHTIYSRNLDAARAGDFDDDGAWELLAPNDNYNGLAAVRHTENGVETAWEIPLGGTLASNIASTTDEEGRIAIAAGTLEGNLRIWR